MSQRGYPVMLMIRKMVTREACDAYCHALRSFRVRQLAAAFWPASLLALALRQSLRVAGTVAISKSPKQPRGEESGSKLPHSKAAQALLSEW